MSPEEIRVEALRAALRFASEDLEPDDVISIAREFEIFITEG